MVNPTRLREIITTNVVTKVMVLRADKWQAECLPYQPDETTLHALLKEGTLAQRLPKAPSTPQRLTPQQRQELQARLANGRTKRTDCGRI